MPICQSKEKAGVQRISKRNSLEIARNLPYRYFAMGLTIWQGGWQLRFVLILWFTFSCFPHFFEAPSTTLDIAEIFSMFGCLISIRTDN
jgi:hypothetical protein